MKGFIVHPTYRIYDGKAFVHLYGRLENGESFLSIHEQRAYFFIKTTDVEKAKKLVPLDFEEDEKKNFLDEAVTKVLLDNPKDVPHVRKILQDQGIVCYEADILFAMRFLMDNNLKGSISLEGNHHSSKEYYGMHNQRYDVDRIYLNPEISAEDDYWPDLKILSFDIETDVTAKDLYSISIVCGDFRKVLIAKKGLWNHADSFENEEEVLKEFVRIVKDLDPDVITGWNVVDFDLAMLRKYAKRYDLDFTLGRDQSQFYLRLAESFFDDSVAKIEGRVVLDGIALLKMNFITLPDYKLQTAAQELLGKEKLMHGEERFQEIQDAFHTDTQKLIDYNLLDSELVLEILEKTHTISLAIARSKLTRMPLDRIRGSIASLDSLYIHALNKRGVVAPTSYNAEREERITGGYVREPIPGIYDNILVFDFKSLYPSIMRTFNIDPYMFVPKEQLSAYSEDEKKELIVSPNGAHFKKEPGILPTILEVLWKERDKAKKEKDKAKSYAIKITMNSFFGVLANPLCRFYSLEMANAITHFGQSLIKRTADEMSKKGHTVIYGDTDSIFVDIKEKDYETCVKKGEEISTWINEYFTSYISETYGLTSKMEIEFEKAYKKLFLPHVRGSTGGAKKRYGGLLVKDGKEEMSFVGLEFVRSDWTEAAKNFQEELLRRIFHGEDIKSYVKSFVKDLKAGVYNEKLQYRKQIRKPVSSYTKTTPPHIRAARKIGREETGVIYYLMTTNGPEERDHVTGRVDYDHYLDKQIRPIAESAVSFFDTTFDELVQPDTQQSLFDFS